MTLTKGDAVMKFDILIKTGQGTLYCAYFVTFGGLERCSMSPITSMK
jgi:hypothetical protein